MYLKKIELQGFKSFANKTVFEFDAGVTGVVGPNGSGKSNVSDAVRWVLGEQSAKQLRGGNMQDVIFAGTQTRKPQGFAYVALTLDNRDHAIALDFDEVTVSRRLYRSGESEYMLNGSICRLKDIHELFYDTGIGKDGYSIIGQGQIDKILSTKPEDRRELFDEAVGITKFKRRKLLTEKKLESERTSLTRINDILKELELRVGPLQKQSEAARKYLMLHENLKKYDVNLFLRETGDLTKELKDIDKNSEILNGDLEATTAASEKLRDQYEDLVNLISGYDETIDTAREKISDANITIGDLTGKANVLNEQIHSERSNEEHIRTRLEAIAREVEQRNTALEGYRTQEEERGSVFDSAMSVQTEAEKKLNDADARIAYLEKHIEDSQNGMITALNERSDINANSEKTAAVQEQLQLRKSEYAQKILKVKSELASVRSQYTQGEKSLADIQLEIDKISDGIADLGHEKAAAQKTVERQNAAVINAQRAVQSAQARYESLRNIVERYDGYGSPVKKVMDEAEKTGGVHGVVADIITVDKQYEIAIETALGGRLQNVVTDNEEVAKKLVAYLKTNRFGRVTFLPLSAMKADKWNPGEVMKSAGVIGLASSLASGKKEYENLIDSLLGRTIVVDTIDHAVAIQKKNGYKFRIVTKDGELLAPGGAISGGAYKNASNLLGRKRELDELDAEVTRQVKNLQDEENKLEKARDELILLDEKIELEKTKLQEAAIRRNTAQITFDSLKEKLAVTTGDSAEMDTELERIEKQLAETNASRSKAKDDIEQLDTKYEELTHTVEDESAELEQLRIRRETFAGELSKAQVDTAGAQEGLSFIKENEDRVQSEIEAFLSEKAELENEISESKTSVSEKQEMITLAEAEIEKLRTSISELEKTVVDTTTLKAAKADEQRAYFEKRDEMAERLSQLDKDIFRLQTRKEKCEEKLDSATTYMWTEYELTLQSAEQYRDEELTDLSEMKKEVHEYKSQIKALGPVNVNAIEEYAEVSERYELMRTQHDDIVAAEEELIKIIEELDEGMRRQFRENFIKIQVEFDKVFKELFGGGTGKLELEEGTDDEGNPIDILDAGVKIIAQPPGKKLQNMMQLSGGEKALTAISLLFAIQNLKPSPFALLDEIEAALDDSNVDRFAKYLHRLARNTQFIVITHRRGTMVAADRLYGITMQEKGISTLVSVKLIENELDN